MGAGEDEFQAFGLKAPPTRLKSTLAEDKNGLMITPTKNKNNSSNELLTDQKNNSHRLQSVLEVDETQAMDDSVSITTDAAIIEEKNSELKLSGKHNSELVGFRQDTDVTER